MRNKVQLSLRAFDARHYQLLGVGLAFTFIQIFLLGRHVEPDCLMRCPAILCDLSLPAVLLESC